MKTVVGIDLKRTFTGDSSPVNCSGYWSGLSYQIMSYRKSVRRTSRRHC